MKKSIVIINKTLVLFIILSTQNACGGSSSGGNVTLPGSLSSPKDVIASYEKNKVRLTWTASEKTVAVKYYIVERSVHYKENFKQIGDKLPITQLEFIDPVIARTFGDSFVYRVIVGNDTKSSTSDVSNVVTPSEILNVSHQAKQVLTSKSPQNRAQFGKMIALSVDGTTMAVASVKSLVGNVFSKAVHIFKRNSLNNWSTEPLAIIQFKNAAKFDSLAFSPDGNTLALGDVFHNIGTVTAAGSVQLISKNSNENWSSTAKTTLLTSSIPGKFYQFGSAVEFSADGNTLAVAELDTGIVSLYTKGTSNKWSTTPKNTFRARSKLSLNSVAIAFHPNGEILAIGDPAVDNGNLSEVGIVQLFSKKVDGTWSNTASTVFKSKQKGAKFHFGQSLAFSADGNSIAIGEYKSNMILENASAYTGGNVQLFSKDNSNAWNLIPKMIFVSSSSEINNFGSVVAFNSAGNILAIGELKSDINFQIRSATFAGSVLIFLKDSLGNWSQTPSALLASQNPVHLGEFGRTFVFSPTDNTLFIGEPRGTTAPNISTDFDKGIVNIYDTTLFQ